MKKNTYIFWLLILLLPFYCQKENSTEPEPGNGSHPQVDIPWPSLAESPWPSTHGDMQCTGRSRYEGPREGKVGWTYFNDGIFNEISGVVIGEDGTIYFCAKPERSPSVNYYLHALNPDGSLKWKKKLEGLMAWTPIIGAGDVIYVAAYGGPFYAFNSDGTVKWTYDTSTIIYTFAPALGLDGTIYFVDVEGTLYALNSDGSLKWTTRGTAGLYMENPNYSIAMSPDGGVLYAGGSDNTFNAIDAHTGSVRWQLPTGYILQTSPLVDCSGNIYFIKLDSTFVIWSVTPEGEFRWKSDVYVHHFVSLHIDKDGNIYAYGGKNKLLCFDYAGNLRWSKVMLDADISIHQTSIRGDCKGMIYFDYTYRYIIAMDQSGNRQFICELPDTSYGRIMGAISSDACLYVAGRFEFFCIK
ncbi:MAG TPA: hypothetical protein ENN22_13470 [bacterium]|nr:hypothetical protein [bacterium]